MKIFLIRHGQSTSDVDKRFGGSYDDPLTDVGKRQVQQLFGLLKYKGISIIYHSPYLRAKESAEILSKYLNARLEEVKDLRERDYFGILSGLTEEEAKKRYKEQLEKLQDYPLEHDIDGSESYLDFSSRIDASIDKLLKSGFGTIAVVTHGGPISHLARRFLNRDVKHLGDCAFIELEAKQDEFKVLAMHNVEMKD